MICALIPKCKYRKRVTFNPRQFQLEGAGFKNNLQKVFKGTHLFGNIVLKPAFNATASVIGMALAAKLITSAVDQDTTNILKTDSGGRILRLTDTHRNGFETASYVRVNKIKNFKQRGLAIRDLFDYHLVRKCSECKNISLESNFHKQKLSKDGLHFQCISCRKKNYDEN